MADKRITQLDAVADADLPDILPTAVFETEQPGLDAPESRKLTEAQVQQILLRLSDLSALLATAGTATLLVPVYDAALANPATDARKMTLAEFRKLIAGEQVRLHAERAKVGTTAGWVVAAANNLGKLATVPAGQAAATLVIPLSGFKIGEKLTKFSLAGSLQSGGNHVTIDADLRMLTANAAGAVDSSLGAIVQVDLTANAILSSANAEKVLAAAHTVAAGESFYVLVTVTTAAACTGELQGVNVTTNETV